MICRSKIAKIVPFENPNADHGGHLENIFLPTSPGQKYQLICM